MPYSDESKYWHARQNEPGQYDSMKHGEIGKGIHVVYGIKGGKSEVQAYLFPKDSFSKGEAQMWLKNHDKKATLEAVGMRRLSSLVEDESEDVAKIVLDGDDWYLTKIDSTHVFLTMDKPTRKNPLHVQQLPNYQMGKDVYRWLGGDKNALKASYERDD